MKRVWLEPRAKEVDSYAKLSVETWAYKSERSHRDLDLKIADCNRNITLYFGYATDRERKAMLAKLNRLQSVLDALREELETPVT